MDKEKRKSTDCKHKWIDDGMGYFRHCELCGLKQRTILIREWEDIGYMKVKPSEVD